jgi:hypothetical protein
MTSHVEETLATALGRQHRDDPVLAGTGGPAGNARLTAWLGLGLLALFLAEMITLLNVSGLISWHIAIGVLLIPPSLVKTATTGWRMVRYYLRATPYVQAGPPPMLLRLLGPLVVLGTIAVLGSGVLLIGLGPTATFRPWFTVLGHDVSPLTLHQGSFIVWGVATGLHVLTRLLPALQIAGAATPLPGGRSRLLLVLGAVAAAVAAAVIVLGLADAWTSGGFRFDRFDHQEIRGG